jgi:hypothetical protein
MEVLRCDHFGLIGWMVAITLCKSLFGFGGAFIFTYNVSNVGGNDSVQYCPFVFNHKNSRSCLVMSTHSSVLSNLRLRVILIYG